MNPDQKKIEAEILLRNNSPIEEFSGLTPSEMNRLLYEPFSKESILQFKDSIDKEVLDSIPFFNVSEEFLTLIQKTGKVKLTKLGNLPRKVVDETYLSYLKRLDFTKHKEEFLINPSDSPFVHSVRFNLEVAGILQINNGNLSLSQIGEDLLFPGKRLELFKKVFTTFTLNFNWSFNDNFTDGPVGQFGFAYNLYLMDKFRDQKKKIPFYAELYIKAFPRLLTAFEDEKFYPVLDQFLDCYYTRFCERFLEWFSLGNINRFRTRLIEKWNLVPSDNFGKIFVFNE